MTGIGRGVMWILFSLIHIQFWLGFVLTWRPLFPDAYPIIDGIAMFGVTFGLGPALYIANRIIP